MQCAASCEPREAPSPAGSHTSFALNAWQLSLLAATGSRELRASFHFNNKRHKAQRGEAAGQCHRLKQKCYPSLGEAGVGGTPQTTPLPRPWLAGHPTLASLSGSQGALSYVFAANLSATQGPGPGRHESMRPA